MRALGMSLDMGLGRGMGLGLGRGMSLGLRFLREGPRSVPRGPF